MVTKRALIHPSKAAPKRAMKWRACALSPWKRLRSAPAEKNFSPVPVMTAAYTERSALSSRTSFSSAVRLSGVHVFAGGLSIVTNAVWPRTSDLMARPSYPAPRVSLLHVLQDDAGEILRPV